MKAMRLIPVYKDYLWGGQKLKTVYGKDSPLNPTAESWELSTHPDGLSVIARGVYQGRTLAEVIASDPTVLGTARQSDELPILVKLIDAADDLSVQVHPDDSMANALEGQNGKTEMWYVMDAEPEAKIVFGLKESVEKEVFEEAVSSNTLTDLLNREDSVKGKSFFVRAGTVHAIGKGNLIAEIQQNSNVTYRLYDYGRRDKTGNLRELHVEKGIRAAALCPPKRNKTPLCSDGSVLLAHCPSFQVREISVDGDVSVNLTGESYLCLMCVDGNLTADGEDFSAGQTLFFPAGAGTVVLNGIGKVLRISHPPRCFAGIDLGGTNIAVGIVDEFGVIYGRCDLPANLPRSAEEVLSDAAKAVFVAVENSGLTMEEIVSVGIGFPGAVNKRAGTVEFSNNLDFYDVPAVSMLEKLLNKSVSIENDANAAAWGEFLAGSGKAVQNMILLTLGTGVGGGIVCDGRLLTGAWGKGAELGHTVIVSGGEPCTCGRRGCLEAYASATALIRQTKIAMKDHPESDLWEIAEGDLEKVTGKTVFLATDSVARQVVEDYAEYLAEGVVNYVNVFQPEAILLGGGVSKSADRLIPILRKAVRERTFARFGNEEPEISAASLGNDAGIVGAALLWKNEA